MNGNARDEFDTTPEELCKQLWPDNAIGSGKAGVEAKNNGNAATADTAMVSVQEFPVLADEAFWGLAGKIARTVGPHTESDPALLLIGSLIYFGNAIGRGPHHVIEGTPITQTSTLCLSGTRRKRARAPGTDASDRSSK
jgi:hypothetical protein